MLAKNQGICLRHNTRLNQILNNLLDNAIKFSYNNSSIDVIITENYASTNDKNKKEHGKYVEDGNRFYVPNKEEIQVAISDFGKGISTKNNAQNI